MTNADQPAFPRTVALLENIRYEPVDGLTKREYFAAMAMQGMLSRGERVIDKRFTDGRTVICNPPDLSKLSIECADELLRQLETPKP